MHSSTPSRIRLGVLTRTHGLDGTLRCTLDFETVPTVGVPSPAWIGYTEAFGTMMTLVFCQAHGDELLCRLEGIGTREEAQKFVDQALFLPPESIGYGNELIDPGVIGFQARSESGEPVGTITGLFRTPAHYIWTIEHEGREWMLPAITEFVVELNRAEKVAVVRPIPGMISEEGTDADGR